MEVNEKLYDHLTSNLPAAFGRSSIEDLLPGIISSKSLANSNSCGEGPPYYKMGRKVFYLREEFLSWLDQRVKRAEM